MRMCSVFTNVKLKLLLFANYLTFLSTVYGCGTTSQGRTINFKVNNFNIPSSMVYSVDMSAPSLAPFISTSEEKAIIFARNLVEQTIQDVLYQQGRGAGLSDDLISLILQQLDIRIDYKPLKCDKVYTDLMGNNAGNGVTNCRIVDNTVTTICDMMAMCNMPNHMKPIDDEHRTISGRIETTNAIMASWSRQMWERVLSRGIQRLASRQFSQFSGASVIIDS